MDGLRLKEFREKFKFSQRDVAKAMNMPQPQYCKWENGQYLPNSAQLLKLCEVFQCTPNDLFGIQGVVKTMHHKIDSEIESKS